MIKTILFILVILSWTIACRNDKQNKTATAAKDTLTTKQILPSDTEENKPETIGFICDTVFKKPGYKITLTIFDSANQIETTPNTLFTFSKLISGHYQTLFSDSIYSKVQKLEFSDFNGDNVKDVLVQNFSTQEAIGHTIYIWLTQLTTDLKRINGFEQIKNPNYLSKYNLIDNMVVSGTNWTSFYKIQGDAIKDFNIVIYDDEDKNGKSTYDRDYEKAIKRILRTEKNNP